MGPANLYRLSQAYRAQGEAAKAQDYLKRAAEFNSLPALPYAFIRAKAQKEDGEFGYPVKLTVFCTTDPNLSRGSNRIQARDSIWSSRTGQSESVGCFCAGCENDASAEQAKSANNRQTLSIFFIFLWSRVTVNGRARFHMR